MNGSALRIAHEETVTSHISGGGLSRAQSGEHAQDAVRGRHRDYGAFQRVLEQACARVSMRLLAYCVMLNHWHPVVWPRREGDLSRFMNWLTLTHMQRWHQHRHTVGKGHVYQGRFTSFHVETNAYLPAGLSRRRAESSAGGPRRTSSAVVLERAGVEIGDKPGLCKKQISESDSG